MTQLWLAILTALLIIAVIVLGPWCFIWGLNTVFELGIEWTWKHWFGVHAIFLMFPRHWTSKD